MLMILFNFCLNDGTLNFDALVKCCTIPVNNPFTQKKSFLHKNPSKADFSRNGMLNHVTVAGYIWMTLQRHELLDWCITMK